MFAHFCTFVCDMLVLTKGDKKMINKMLKKLCQRLENYLYHEDTWSFLLKKLHDREFALKEAQDEIRYLRQRLREK